MIFINYKNPHTIYKNRQSINEIEHIYKFDFSLRFNLENQENILKFNSKSKTKI